MEPRSPESRHRQRLVVALDQSEYAEIVLEHALDLAGRYQSVVLHFLTVQEPTHRFGRSPPGDEDLNPDVKTRLHQLVAQGLETFSRNTTRPEPWLVRLHARVGEPGEEIAGLATDLQADLVVLGRFGLSGTRRHGRLGSVADKVLRLATCPTLVVQLSEFAPPQSVAQCPECVEIRRASDGEQWFCPAHLASPDTRIGNATVLLPHADWGLHGGLLW